MRTIWNHTATGLIARFGLAAVWGYAGLLKIFEPGGAYTAIVGYRLGIPGDVAQLIGYALPALEIGLALLLIAGIWVKPAAMASFVINGLFIVGIIQVWIRGYSIDCGCFGSGGDVDPEGRHLRYTQYILRDLLFMLMAWRLVRNPVTPFSLTPQNREN